MKMLKLNTTLNKALYVVVGKFVTLRNGSRPRFLSGALPVKSLHKRNWKTAKKFV